MLLMEPLLDITKIKSIAINRIWIRRYRIPINTSANEKLAKSKYNLRIIVHYFDKYYQDCLPEERKTMFNLAYFYFPRRVPFWVILGRRMNIIIGREFYIK